MIISYYTQRETCRKLVLVGHTNSVMFPMVMSLQKMYPFFTQKNDLVHSMAFPGRQDTTLVIILCPDFNINYE